MRVSYKHNPMRIMTEILASVYRCEINKKNATVGQVHSRLINIRLSREQVRQGLQDLWDWGLLESEPFQYRPNVASKIYRLNPRTEQREIIRGLLRYCEDILCHFPELDVNSEGVTKAQRQVKHA